MASSAFQGSLFSNAFVEGAITDLPDWSALADQALAVWAAPKLDAQTLATYQPKVELEGRPPTKSTI